MHRMLSFGKQVIVGRLLVRVTQNWGVDFRKDKGVWLIVSLGGQIFVSWKHKATKLDMLIEVGVKKKKTLYRVLVIPTSLVT